MRTLSSTLLAAQKSGRLNPLVRVALSQGVNSYTYEKDRILDIEKKEEAYSHKAKITLNNSDGTLTSLSLQGYKAVISFGINTSAGDEYSAQPALYVIGQEFDSSPGNLSCTLTCVGIFDLLAEDRASANYQPASTNTDTVKTIIAAILGATLACYNHTTAWTVTWDSEDSLVDVYTPKDSFRVFEGQTRLAKLRALLDYTKVVMKVGNEATPQIHFSVPLTTAPDESNDVAVSGYRVVYDVNWRAQTFTPASDVQIESVDLYCRASGAGTIPGNITVSIRATAAGFPTGADLASISISGSLINFTTAQYYKFKLSTLTTLTGGTVYAIVWRAPSAADTLTFDVGYNNANPYAGGKGSQSTDSGASWFNQSGGTEDFLFKVNAYDYTYSLVSGDHLFLSKALRQRLVIPNKVTVRSLVGAGTAYSASTTDTTSYALLPMEQFERTYVANTAQALAISTALLSKYQMHAETGAALVMENVGAEVYDFVNVTDARQSDSRSGNIGSLAHNWNAKKGEWTMSFQFGGWLSMRKLLNDIETYQGGVSALGPTTNGRIPAAYIENLTAGNISVTGGIFLTGTNTIDDVSDGSSYKRVLATAITAGLIRLDEGVVDGTSYKRVAAAALSPAGLVLLSAASGNIDDIDDGTTNGKVLLTNLSAGNIKLTSNIVASGKWYDTGGVQINASTGILLYGQNNNLVTKASSTSAVQCYVGSDGYIYAGGGAVALYDGGISIAGSANALVTRSGASHTSAIQCYVSSSGAIAAGAGKVWMDATGITIQGTSGTIDTLKLEYVAGTVTATGNMFPGPGGVVIDVSGTAFTAPNALYVRKGLSVGGTANSALFGLIEAGTDGVVSWFDNGGARNHTFAPETDGKGQLGNSTLAWGKVWAKAIDGVVSQTAYAAATARQLSTEYQNTSGKVRLVTVSIAFTMGTEGLAPTAYVYIGGTSLANTLVARSYESTVNGNEERAMTFLVPKDWFYRVAGSAGSGTVTRNYWTEWDLY